MGSEINLDKKYNIIYADPPWKYRDKRKNPDSDRPAKYGGISYDVMDTKDICNLPINKIADENCMLFMWVTFPNLQIGLDVIKAWGFDYRTLGFSWIKLNKKNEKPFFGIGYYTKSNCECCLIGVKGKPIVVDNTISSVLMTPREGHSKKPDVVRDKIVQLCGDLPRIELFARERAEGWDSWGNEI